MAGKGTTVISAKMVAVFKINVGSMFLGKYMTFQRQFSPCCSCEGVEKKQQLVELKNIIHDFKSSIFSKDEPGRRI